MDSKIDIKRGDIRQEKQKMVVEVWKKNHTQLLEINLN